MTNIDMKAITGGTTVHTRRKGPVSGAYTALYTCRDREDRQTPSHVNTRYVGIAHNGRPGSFTCALDGFVVRMNLSNDTHDNVYTELYMMRCLCCPPLACVKMAPLRPMKPLSRPTTTPLSPWKFLMLQRREWSSREEKAGN